VSKIRTNYRNPFLFFDFDTLIAHAIEEETPQTEHERHELNTMIEKGLDQIAPKYKEVIILYYIESLSYKEIADILSVPTGTVSIRLKRARDALKNVYHAMHFHL
jgi:RNA polymerase sigma-70 factor (ECF subfamily)